MSFNIEVEGGSSVRLPTAGKYCDRDIVVTAINDGGSYDEGYEQGKQEAWQYVTRMMSTFNGATFPSGYEMAISVPSRNDATVNQFINGATGLRKLTITNNPMADVKSYFAFSGAHDLEELDLSNFVQGGGAVVVTDASYLFYGDTKLRAIYGELDFSAGVNLSTAFTNCTSLEEVRIKAGTLNKSMTFAPCSKLSNASIQSIVEGLADLTGQTTQTLTLHADVGAKLTDEQKASVTAKNWTLAY